jgi:RecA/RadA recombinase
MANKWMKILQNEESAVDTGYDAFSEENVIRSPSPSLNWILGKAAGIPKGSSILFYGPQKAGKSLATYLIAGNIHKNDPEGIVVRFDTEMRAIFQSRGPWGIDYSRYMPFDTNNPTEVFDLITGKIKDLIDDGMPLRAIIIDSMTALMGIREADAESISDSQMGDRANAVTKGLKRILPIIRKHKIILMVTAHLRANFEAGLYGPKEKAALAWAEKHFFETYVEVKRDNSTEGKTDLSGNKLENAEIKDFRGNKEITGHKIYVKNTECSFGGAGRSGQFTIDYSNGLINTNEELFELVVNLNLVERPNNRTYIFDGKSYSSKGDFAEAIKNDPKLYEKLENLVYSKDS